MLALLLAIGAAAAVLMAERGGPKPRTFDDGVAAGKAEAGKEHEAKLKERKRLERIIERKQAQFEASRSARRFRRAAVVPPDDDESADEGSA